MKNKKGQAQKRAVRYEKKKARDFRAKHVGGPGKEDAKKGGQKFEMKDRKTPVTKPELIKMKRRRINRVISKSGFTKPAIDYGKGRIKLYKGRKRIA